MSRLRYAAPVLLALAAPLAQAIDPSAAVPDTCATLPAPPPSSRVMAQEDPAAQFDAKFNPAAASARSQLDKALKKNPKDVRALADRGYVNALGGKRDAALADFRAAYALAPDDRHLAWTYGWGRYLLGDYACAAEGWQRVLQSGATPEWAGASLGLAYWQLGDKKNGVLYLRATIRANAQRWGTPAGLKQAVATWPPAAREEMVKLQEYWAEKTP